MAYCTYDINMDINMFREIAPYTPWFDMEPEKLETDCRIVERKSEVVALRAMGIHAGVGSSVDVRQVR